VPFVCFHINNPNHYQFFFIVSVVALRTSNRICINDSLFYQICFWNEIDWYEAI